jgi:hypothetical protein
LKNLTERPELSGLSIQKESYSWVWLPVLRSPGQAPEPEQVRVLVPLPEQALQSEPSRWSNYRTLEARRAVLPLLARRRSGRRQKIQTM